MAVNIKHGVVLSVLKNGSSYMDRAGNQKGCCGISIRNEEILYIMSLICKQLDIERKNIR